MHSSLPLFFNLRMQSKKPKWLAVLPLGVRG